MPAFERPDIDRYYNPFAFRNRPPELLGLLSIKADGDATIDAWLGWKPEHQQAFLRRLCPRTCRRQCKPTLGRPLLRVRADFTHLYDSWLWVEPAEQHTLLAQLCPRTCYGQCGHGRRERRDFWDEHMTRARRKGRERRADHAQRTSPVQP